MPHGGDRPAGLSSRHMAQAAQRTGRGRTWTIEPAARLPSWYPCSIVRKSSPDRTPASLPDPT